jgi:hypothetical protein
VSLADFYFEVEEVRANDLAALRASKCYIRERELGEVHPEATPRAGEGGGTDTIESNQDLSSMSSGRVLIKPGQAQRRGRQRGRAAGRGCDLRRHVNCSSIAQYFHNHKTPQICVHTRLPCLGNIEREGRERERFNGKSWHCECSGHI